MQALRTQKTKQRHNTRVKISVNQYSFLQLACLTYSMPVKQITVGLELEMTRAGSFINNVAADKFGRRSDSSILDQNGNKLPRNAGQLELVTPILTADCDVSPNGDKCRFDTGLVENTVADLCRCADQVNSSCGFHVHLGRPNGETSTWNPRRLPNTAGGPASEWKPGHVRTWLIIGLGLEDQLFNVVPSSRRQVRHCRPIREIYSTDKLQAYYPLCNLASRKYNNPERYCWLNLVETCRKADPSEERVGYGSSTPYGTAEIRMLGETRDPAYAATWTRLWVKIAAAIAYLPAESAIMRCVYTNWLQPELQKLRQQRDYHENHVAPSCRSVLNSHTGPTITEEE